MEEQQKLTDKEFFEKIPKIDNPKYDLDYTRTFKKSVQLSYKSNRNLAELYVAIETLVQTGFLPAEYGAHPLTGFPRKMSEKVMECHIKSDWLLVWLQNDKILTLMLTNTGSHSELFGSKRLRK
jgi:mRNA interferase YafQ